jgi:FecR protein
MTEHDHKDPDEERLSRLLRAAGPRPPLPEDLKHSWDAHFRAELASARAQRNKLRRRSIASIAAAVVAVTAGLFALLREPAPTAPLIQVTSITGSARWSAAQGPEMALAQGQLLASGEAIYTAATGYVALRWAGYDLRLNSETRVSLADDGVYLHRGELYASDNPAGISHIQLAITTPHGVIRDIGTQFTVKVGQEKTLATVRRGALQLQAGNTTHQARAEPGSARQISIDSAQQIDSTQVATTGSHWQWIYHARPSFELAGQSARAFLQWSVSESGLELTYDSAAAKAYAQRTELHGSIDGLDPEAAIGPVLASTDLVAEVRGGVLHIALRQPAPH